MLLPVHNVAAGRVMLLPKQTNVAAWACDAFARRRCAHGAKRAGHIHTRLSHTTQVHVHVGLARTKYIYDIFGREITIFTVINGVHIGLARTVYTHRI
jgi:hypothetical protein